MAAKEDQLDASFLAGIKEELASIEENEKNIQALSQVFRYYTKYAKQLTQVLYDFASKQCFPWEIIHAMHLVDDILLMDNTGRYKAEFVDRIKGIAVRAFLKVQSDQERKEVAHMLQTWQELKIFDRVVLEAIKTAIRAGGAGGAAGLKLLDEIELPADDGDSDPEESKANPSASLPPAGGVKRKREEAAAPASNDAAVAAALEARRKREAQATKVASKDLLKPVVATIKTRVLKQVENILAASSDKPFAVLDIPADSDGAAIRKAYRKLALIIHPDKNPGAEDKCQEALVKLQQAREQAEAQQQKTESDKSETLLSASKGDTRSAATAAKNEDADGTFKCRYPGCDLPPCKQCANGCCTRNITHCHQLARSKGGLQCFFHPPPRAWARNA